MVNEKAESRPSAALLQLGLLRAVDLAVRRHQEVFAVILASNDRAEAGSAIQALLGVDEVEARAVLSLQWDRLTREEMANIADAVASQVIPAESQSWAAGTSQRSGRLSGR